MNVTTIKKGIELLEYCANKYGMHNAKYICSRFGTSLALYDLDQLKKMADRMAVIKSLHKNDRR